MRTEVSRDEWLLARKELLAAAFERGLDILLTPYNYLDLTPLGRQDGIDDFKLHDTYTDEELAGKAGQ